MTRHICFDLGDKEWERWYNHFKALPDWDYAPPISPGKIGHYLKRKVENGEFFTRRDIGSQAYILVQAPALPKPQEE